MTNKKNTNWRPWIAIGAALCGIAILISIAGAQKTPTPAAAPAPSPTPTRQVTPEGYFRNYKNELVKNPTKEELNAAQSPKAQEPAPAPAVAAFSNWTYTRETDEMSGREKVIACVVSTNSVRLKWPYKAQPVRLCVRKHPSKGVDVYVRLTDDGQFICDSWDGCTVRLRFDELEAAAYSAVTSDSGSRDIIFLSNHKRFLANVGKAKTLRVEANFYEAGSQVMIFKVVNLNWPNGGK